MSLVPHCLNTVAPNRLCRLLRIREYDNLQCVGTRKAREEDHHCQGQRLDTDLAIFEMTQSTLVLRKISKISIRNNFLKRFIILHMTSLEEQHTLASSRFDIHKHEEGCDPLRQKR